MRRIHGVTDTEIAAIGNAVDQVRTIAPHRDFVKEGREPEHLHIVLDGWAARCKTLGDGRRQISALALPGEICDLDGLYVRRYDYSVGALTQCRIATIPRAAVADLSGRMPAIGRALSWLAIVENAIMTEWVLSLGRRSAAERMAHLLCELSMRMSAVGETQQDSLALPLTQAQLSEVLGLTAVHVNRTLKDLRADGLVEVRRGILTIIDKDELARFAHFDPNYLHLDGMRLRKAA